MSQMPSTTFIEIITQYCVNYATMYQVKSLCTRVQWMSDVMNILKNFGMGLMPPLKVFWKASGENKLK